MNKGPMGAQFFAAYVAVPYGNSAARLIEAGCSAAGKRRIDGGNALADRGIGTYCAPDPPENKGFTGARKLKGYAEFRDWK